mmetsp:Transcript_125713/g.217733  ORF Transcript_125713/g.217733 Transcript_125713/m.217733 type:complete len:202 (+) Transcript_125713:1068-1673(+)
MHIDLLQCRVPSSQAAHAFHGPCLWCSHLYLCQASLLLTAPQPQPLALLAQSALLAPMTPLALLPLLAPLAHLIQHLLPHLVHPHLLGWRPLQSSRCVQRREGRSAWPACPPCLPLQRVALLRRSPCSWSLSCMQPGASQDLSRKAVDLPLRFCLNRVSSLEPCACETEVLPCCAIAGSTPCSGSFRLCNHRQHERQSEPP